MRKLIISLIFLSIVQISKAQKMNYSVGLGGNFSYWHYKITDSNNQTSKKNTSTTFGFNLDFRVDYSFNKLVGLSSGLDYIRKDSKNVNRHYVSLPFLISIKPVEKFSFDLGCDIERLLYANDESGNVTDLFNKTDLDLICGINYQVFPRFQTSVHYYHSLKSSYAFDYNGIHNVSYNRSIVISLLYGLNKNNK